MKYNININQVKLNEIANWIDLKEAAILDYLIVICKTNNKKVAQKRKDWFTWVNYTRLIEDMPLLNIKSKWAITPKIKTLEKYGLINLKTHWQDVYVSLTEKVDELFLDITVQRNEQPSHRNRQTVHENEQNCSQKWTADRSYLWTNNNTIYNNNTDNTKSKNFKFQSKRELKDFITEMYNKDNLLFDINHLKYIWPWLEKLRERGYKVQKIEWDIIWWYKYFKETTVKYCWITNTWPAFWEMDLVLERMFNWLDEKEKKSWNIKNTILTFLTRSKWK